MGDPIGSQTASPNGAATSARSPLHVPPSPPPPPPVSLVPPSPKKKRKSGKTFRVLRSVFRSFPILTPATCKFPSLPGGALPDPHRGVRTGTKITGTLFGYRKGRVTLSLQETPRCLPTLVLQLAIHMTQLQKDLSTGMVRIALECEKQVETSTKDKTKLFDEPMWTMYYNGKKTGYGVKREAVEEDLYVMELLKAVSMGAGVLPARNEECPDSELTYMRTQFEHVVGSRDSETLYMLSPEGNSGPELTIFMVRL